MFIRESTISPILQYILFILLIVFSGLAVYYLIYIGNEKVDDEKKLNINWKTVAKFIIITSLIAIIVYLYRRYPVLGLSTSAIFLSALIAFLLNPIVKLMEKYKIPRGLGVLISYILIVVILVFLGIAIVPDLVKQTTTFLSNLPSTVMQLTHNVEELLKNWNINSSILTDFRNTANEYLIEISRNIPKWLESLINTIQGGFSAIIVLVLVPIITFYFIIDKEKILRNIYNIIPKAWKKDSYYLYKEINFAMKEFIISRALMAIFIGVSTGIMLWLFGIPFAIIIGIITAIMDIVPYVGPVIATAPALIFAFIRSPMTFVWVAILSWFLQWIEQNIVGPKLFSSSSGLHEVVILISIIIGGGLFGVWGMILSVPAVVIIKILIEYSFMKMRGIEPKFTKDLEKQNLKESRSKKK